MSQHRRVAAAIAVACLGALALPAGGRAGVAADSQVATPIVTSVPSTPASTPQPRLLARALFVPAFSARVSSTGTVPIIVSGSGFAGNEPVGFQFGQVDPFTDGFSNVLFSISGLADGQGRVGNLIGTHPLSITSIPSNPPAGWYVLRGQGAISGRVAETAISLPFQYRSDGVLGCPVAPLAVGQSFTVSGAGLPPNQDILGVADLPQAPQAAASADGAGAAALQFSLPEGIAGERYAVVVATVSDGGTGLQMEQLHSCELSLAAPATPSASPSPAATGTATPGATAPRGSSIVALPTAIPTTGPPPTRIPTPAHATLVVPLRLRLGLGAVEQGQLQTLSVTTRPLTRLRFSLRYAGTGERLSESTRADSAGRASFPFVVADGPAEATSPLTGTVSIAVADAGATGAAQAQFAVYPSLHLLVQTHLAVQEGVTVLALAVQIARAGHVTASAQLPGGDARQVTASGDARGDRVLTLWLPLGTLDAPVTVPVTVRATARDGVTLVRTISLSAGA